MDESVNCPDEEDVSNCEIDFAPDLSAEFEMHPNITTETNPLPVTPFSDMTTGFYHIEQVLPDNMSMNVSAGNSSELAEKPVFCEMQPLSLYSPPPTVPPTATYVEQNLDMNQQALPAYNRQAYPMHKGITVRPSSSPLLHIAPRSSGYEPQPQYGYGNFPVSNKQKPTCNSIPQRPQHSSVVKNVNQFRMPPQRENSMVIEQMQEELFRQFNPRDTVDMPLARGRTGLESKSQSQSSSYAYEEQSSQNSLLSDIDRMEEEEEDESVSNLALLLAKEAARSICAIEDPYQRLSIALQHTLKAELDESSRGYVGGLFSSTAYYLPVNVVIVGSSLNLKLRVFEYRYNKKQISLCPQMEELCPLVPLPSSPLFTRFVMDLYSAIRPYCSPRLCLTAPLYACLLAHPTTTCREIWETIARVPLLTEMMENLNTVTSVLCRSVNWQQFESQWPGIQSIHERAAKFWCKPKFVNLFGNPSEKLDVSDLSLEDWWFSMKDGPFKCDAPEKSEVADNDEKSTHSQDTHATVYSGKAKEEAELQDSENYRSATSAFDRVGKKESRGRKAKSTSPMFPSMTECKSIDKSIRSIGMKEEEIEEKEEEKKPTKGKKRGRKRKNFYEKTQVEVDDYDENSRDSTQETIGTGRGRRVQRIRRTFSPSPVKSRFGEQQKLNLQEMDSDVDVEAEIEDKPIVPTYLEMDEDGNWRTPLSRRSKGGEKKKEKGEKKRDREIRGETFQETPLYYKTTKRRCPDELEYFHPPTIRDTTKEFNELVQPSTVGLDPVYKWPLLLEPKRVKREYGEEGEGKEYRGSGMVKGRQGGMPPTAHQQEGQLSVQRFGMPELHAKLLSIDNERMREAKKEEERNTVVRAEIQNAAPVPGPRGRLPPPRRWSGGGHPVIHDGIEKRGRDTNYKHDGNSGQQIVEREQTQVQTSSASQLPPNVNHLILQQQPINTQQTTVSRAPPTVLSLSEWFVNDFCHGPGSIPISPLQGEETDGVTSLASATNNSNVVPDEVNFTTTSLLESGEGAESAQNDGEDVNISGVSSSDTMPLLNPSIEDEESPWDVVESPVASQDNGPESIPNTTCLLKSEQDVVNPPDMSASDKNPEASVTVHPTDTTLGALSMSERNDSSLPKSPEEQPLATGIMPSSDLVNALSTPDKSPVRSGTPDTVSSSESFGMSSELLIDTLLHLVTIDPKSDVTTKFKKHAAIQLTDEQIFGLIPKGGHQLVGELLLLKPTGK